MSAGVRTPRSNMKQGTQTRDRTAQACSKPYTYMKTRHDGSVRALSQNPWMPPERSDRTLIIPPPPPSTSKATPPGVTNEGHQEQDRNMTAQEHGKHDYTRLTHKNRQNKKIKTQRQRGEGGRGAKPVPAGKPRQSQVSREGQDGWVREAQAVQESQKWARMEPEGRTREAPAKQEPWRIARAGLEGQSREVPAKHQPWKMVRAGPEGQTRRALACQEAKVNSAGQGAWAWVEPAGQGA